ncbi:glycosyltransferase [Microbacterium sp. KUDC0406]|uniref:glycosyltransferase n=1 Tax=Microbacterium sp. KUDC0406 TaxID=2909588 RepID=UPI001F15B757|nr:glycosyltransferase [Microbacterium sp. KUDC0406]UJP09576.1 glycosyltransferase [Microbacterium sp. KUDC0406]
MRRYAERFDSAEVVVNPHPRGLATARNQGLVHVEGDAFCFLDGDDWMQPRRLEVLVRALGELRCDFLRTDHVTVKRSERRLVRAPFTHRGAVADPRTAILPADDRTMVDYPCAWAGILHRRVLDQGLAGFTDGLFTAEDRPWIWRLHLRASSFAVVDAPHLLYRRGVTDSLSKTLDRRQLDFSRALGEVLDLVESDPDAAPLMPKAVVTVLALSAHHLVRARRMQPAVRRELRSGIRDLLARLPQEEARAAVAQLGGPRRRVLARTLREATRVSPPSSRVRTDAPGLPEQAFGDHDPGHHGTRCGNAAGRPGGGRRRGRERSPGHGREPRPERCRSLPTPSIRSHRLRIRSSFDPHRARPQPGARR